MLASQAGRDVDIVNTFELPLCIEGETELDKEFLAYKLDQCKVQKKKFLKKGVNTMFFAVKQVFPNLDLMGWYSLGATPTEADLKLHKQVRQFCTCMSGQQRLKFPCRLSL